MPPVLSIEDLSVEYRTREGPIRALRRASLTLERGQILALVGESGSGKTTLGLSILRILPRSASVTSGRVLYQRRDITELDREELQQIRGDQISMIFQDPIAGLNPIISVGDQVQEVITSHRAVEKREARELALDALAQMRLPDPARIAKAFPGELSGGMCQRIMIAIATALDPQILIADEPTSSLDVTVQAQILYELERLRDERGTAILLITHDMGVVAQIAERVAVVYAGAIVELDDIAPPSAPPATPTPGRCSTPCRGSTGGASRACRKFPARRPTSPKSATIAPSCRAAPKRSPAAAKTPSRRSNASPTAAPTTPSPATTPSKPSFRPDRRRANPHNSTSLDRLSDLCNAASPSPASHPPSEQMRRYDCPMPISLR